MWFSFWKTKMTWLPGIEIIFTIRLAILTQYQSVTKKRDKTAITQWHPAWLCSWMNDNKITAHVMHLTPNDSILSKKLNNKKFIKK